MSIDSQMRIAAVCDDVKELLLAKNVKYGDSALNPLRVLSRSSAVEQILVRIDDKLNRIKQGNILEDDEDVITDLIGYFVLLKVALTKEDQSSYNNDIESTYNVFIPGNRFDSEESFDYQSEYPYQTRKNTDLDVGYEKYFGERKHPRGI